MRQCRGRSRQCFVRGNQRPCKTSVVGQIEEGRNRPSQHIEKRHSDAILLDVPLVLDTRKFSSEFLYQYISFIVQNNATGESQAEFRDTPHPYFDSLYCSWDTVSADYTTTVILSSCVLPVSDRLPVHGPPFSGRLCSDCGHVYRWLAKARLDA